MELFWVLDLDISDLLACLFQRFRDSLPNESYASARVSLSPLQCRVPDVVKLPTFCLLCWLGTVATAAQEGCPGEQILEQRILEKQVGIEIPSTVPDGLPPEFCLRALQRLPCGVLHLVALEIDCPCLRYWLGIAEGETPG